MPSAPIIPQNDPTLIFTNAGMNQFKDVFLELGVRNYSRAVNSQKCIRVSGKHNDLDNVGPSPYHHTFFEMLGNWSFGDYYKREAIKWAWELLIKEWQLDPKRMFATIYEGDEEVPLDEEARTAWLEETEISPDHISFHGRKDNFWEMGEVGPCGPCSELHYDLGASFCRKQNEPNHRCAVNGDCGRVIELWNLVFIQFHRDEAGKLHSLPRRHVDTGAGFERIMLALENVRSNYETSLFAPIVAYLAHLSGVEYHRDVRGNPHRVAADHIRSLSFAIADGVLPSNDGRGYVIRRILRRAAKYGREIGLDKPFLYKLVDPLTAVMGDAYPDLRDRYQHIVAVIKSEEESFGRTLGRGIELFNEMITELECSDNKEISGENAFKLYDTFGFPLDLTELMAREHNLSVDIDKFGELMKQQRERARGEGKFEAIFSEVGTGIKTDFIGYDSLKIDAIVKQITPNKNNIEIILDRTPFYAESGGQVSDIGEIVTTNGKLIVSEVLKSGDAIVHRGQWKGQELPSVGESVTATVFNSHREPTQFNHTATHLLHTALRKHLGSHVHQAGSLVAPDRLRFDYTYHEKPSNEQLELIEKTVNASIREDFEVKWYQLPLKDALSRGITALFGEKYGETVRVVQIGNDEKPYSRELCGGTHTTRTGKLGLFRITSESAVSAGVRRIEAVTGEYALNCTLNDRSDLEKICVLLGSHGSSPVEKLEKTLNEKREIEKELEQMVLSWAKITSYDLIKSAVIVGNVRVIAKLFPVMTIDRLKIVGDAIRSSDNRAAALLTSPTLAGAGQLCCVVSDALIQEGKLKAGDLVGKAAKVAGGGGGGKPHLATAGAKSPEKLSLAVVNFVQIVKDTLGVN